MALALAHWLTGPGTGALSHWRTGTLALAPALALALGLALAQWDFGPLALALAHWRTWGPWHWRTGLLALALAQGQDQCQGQG